MFIGALLLALSASWLASTSHAGTILPNPAPVTLSSLLAQGATYTVGDKKFSGFSLPVDRRHASRRRSQCRPDHRRGRQLWHSIPGSVCRLALLAGRLRRLITYMVEALDPNKLISDAHLAGNPTLLGTQGSISVTETFLPLGPGGEYTMKIFDDESVGQKLTDQTFFNPPVRKLNVQKDILVIATPQSQTVTMSFVDQTFSQMSGSDNHHLGAHQPSVAGWLSRPTSVISTTSSPASHAIRLAGVVVLRLRKPRARRSIVPRGFLRLMNEFVTRHFTVRSAGTVASRASALPSARG